MKTWLLCLALMLPVSGWAQFKCLMPSGVVIFNQLSNCPADALKSEALEEVPDGIKPQFKGTYREPQPQPPEPKRQQRAISEQPAKQVDRNIVDEAYEVCAFIRTKGATSCKVEVNFFSASYIDATVPVSAEVARWVCLGVANKTRTTGSPFIGKGWTLKLFSPYGAGTRPIAECNL